MFTVSRCTLEAHVVDITTLAFDAIVNAANTSLLGRRRCRWCDPSCSRARVC